MELKDLDEKINALDQESKEKDEKERLLWIKKEYHGTDEVIDSLKYYKDFKKEEVLFRAYSGLPTLDKELGGFRPGTINIFSGITKQGKTVLFQTLTMNFTKSGLPCLWFSFDTPSFELIERFEKMLPTFYLPRRSPPSKTLKWIEEKIIEGIAKYNTRIVFIDHLQSLSIEGKSNLNQATDLEVLMMGLKDIALRWNLILMVNHHINSAADITKVPRWNNLKNSSGIPQNADLVIMVWREILNIDPSGEITYTPDTGKVAVQLNRRGGKAFSIRVKKVGPIFKEIGNSSDGAPNEKTILGGNRSNGRPAVSYSSQ